MNLLETFAPKAHRSGFFRFLHFDPAISAALRASTLNTIGAADPCDAIVIGAGAAGGFAAVLLAEKGLRVLILDAGSARSRLGSLSRRIGRIGTSRLFNAARLQRIETRRQPIQSRCYAWRFAPDAFIDDIKCPYSTAPNRPFLWFRARQLGGRLIIPGHGRQYYRFGSGEWCPNDGLSPRWPLRPGELDKWYLLVERRVRLSGMRDGLACVPDSALTQLLELTPSEVRSKEAIVTNWPNAHVIVGRSAPAFNALGAAAQTGRVLIRQGAIVREIEVDRLGRVTGAIWFDERSQTEQRARAPLVFLCASALESTRILLLSRSSRKPDGLGAASGALGRFLMDHIKISAEGYGPLSSLPSAHDPWRCLYLPRFEKRKTSVGPQRGYGVQLYLSPGDTDRSGFRAISFAEMLPRADNRVTLDLGRKDAWGIPVLRIDCAHSDIEIGRAREQAAALRELGGALGMRITRVDEAPAPPGASNHECGTARMGNDPGDSVLNAHNECWDARGLYVTDAACFPSQGTHNPVLTILALTARACHHAVGAWREE
jgi:choline dehydrogenase-like flavoprotein